jgi:hypothetical protein
MPKQKEVLRLEVAKNRLPITDPAQGLSPLGDRGSAAP